MASPDTYEQLRRMTGEMDSDRFNDTDLDEFLVQAQGDLNSAASAVWTAKMNEYADMVNTSEAGSSRSNGVLYDRAKEQADRYAAMSNSTPAVGSYSTTRPIVRK